MPFELKARWEQLKDFDRITILFFLVLDGFIVLFHMHLPHWYLSVLKHGLAVMLILIVIPWLEQRSRQPMVHFLRHWYLVFAYTFIYWDVGHYIHLIFPGFFDQTIIRLETWIFGISPNLWLQRLDYPLLTELMQLAYASYWFTIPIGAAMFYFHKRYREYEVFLFTVSLTFFLSYLLFILVPATGPRIALADQITATYRGILLAPVIRRFVAHSGLVGGAFPSSHVAVAVVVLCFLWHYFPTTGRRIFLPIVIGLSLGTVFGQYHYLTDVIAGLAMGLLLGVYGVRYCQRKTARVPAEAIPEGPF